MHVLLTGATGYVGKYLVAHLLQTTDYTLVLPIRPKRGKSAAERFEHEFRKTTLFGTDVLQAALQSRITVVHCDVATLQSSHLAGVNMVVHNAANVSFFESADVLYKDNVDSMIHLTKLVNSAESITRFLYVSTCYVHPKDGRTKGAATLLPPDISQESFINSYAYSKYLAEQELVKRLDLHPEILRLSIVGAPIGPLRAHPCKGAAHLSILQALLQNRLTHVWTPNYVKLNILPVDIVIDAIADQMKGAVPDGPVVKQVCAPADNPSYTISLKMFSEYILRTYKPLVKDAVLNAVEDFQEFFDTCKKAIRIPEYVDMIIKANRVIHSVDHSPYFECSLDRSKLPPLTPEKHTALTCEYVLRSIQELSLKKGIPFTNSDKIIKLLDNPTMAVQVQVPENILSLPIQELKHRLYNALCTNRKVVAVAKEGVWYHGGMISQGSLILEIECESQEDVYRWLQTHSIPLTIACRAILVKLPSSTSLFLQGNHIHMDGMGGMMQIDAFSEILLDQMLPLQETSSLKLPRELPLWEDLWIGVRYAGWMVLDIAKQVFTMHPPKQEVATMSMVQTKEGEIPLRPGMTFAESYAKDLVESMKDKSTVRLCIPANVASPFSRMKQPSCNHTSLYYVDVSPNQSDAEFRETFKVFRSKTVKWLTLLLGAILSTFVPSVLKQCIHSVDLIYSNLHLPQFQNPITPAVFMPVQKPQETGSITITLNGTTTHTIVSRDTSAKTLQESLQSIWKSRKSEKT